MMVPPLQQGFHITGISLQEQSKMLYADMQPKQGISSKEDLVGIAMVSQLNMKLTKKII